MKRAIKLVVTVGILAFLFHKVGARHILGRVSGADRAMLWGGFAACVAAYCAMQVLKAYRLQVLLRAVGVAMGLVRLSLIYFIGMFFNIVLPTLVGGDAVRIAYLYRDAGKFDRAAASTVVERVIGTAALILMALVALVLSSRRDADPHMTLSVLFVTTGFVAGCLVLFTTWAYRLAMACLRAVGLGKLGHVVHEIQGAMTAYRRQGGVLAYTTALSLVANLMMVGIHVILARALGLNLSLWFLLMAVPVTVLISMAPITMSGLGVREATWVFLLQAQGVPQADALAFSLLWFLVTAVASVFGGPAFLLMGKPAQPAAVAAPAPEPAPGLAVDESPMQAEEG